MRYSTHWHYLPATVQDQARARWPSGERAAGPGDWYLYEYELLDLPPGYQLSLFDTISRDDLRRAPRLVGRRPERPTAPVVHYFGPR